MNSLPPDDFRGLTFRGRYREKNDRLREFYLPVLERTREYWRKTGYFSSNALAMASAGLVRFVQTGGRVRIICGAQLSEADAEAIRAGHEEMDEILAGALLRELDPGTDTVRRRRLEILAWLVSQGLLEFKIALREDGEGNVIPWSEAEPYFHTKVGLFFDAHGNVIAFEGSVNETERGWKENGESFTVLLSWPQEWKGEPLGPKGASIEELKAEFDELWRGKDGEWRTVDVPRAVREGLLRYCPAEPPSIDPEEEQVVPPPAAPVPSSRDRVLFHFLREAPFLPNAAGLGVETSPVVPWPHQEVVVEEIVTEFPRNVLIADEVGLGKTIEAGLILRQLVLAGRVRRALLLVPAAVLRQWQEELWEKCALDMPRLVGGELRNVFDQPTGSEDPNPWKRAPVLLASSQLARRRERQDELLASGSWDLILVDEAHHARRKEFLTDEFRPNRLLELLFGTANRSGLRDRTRALLLLTATPMQVNPVEVWDLLRVLGMGGRWASREEHFGRFFQELRKPGTERDWDFLLDLIRDHLATGGRIDPRFEELAQERLGPVRWTSLRELPDRSRARRRSFVRELGDDEHALLNEFLRRHTPVRTLIRRSTRELLRKYRERGLLTENIPKRDPEAVWVPMTIEEMRLYERIEEYISDFYQRYENERKGLGFIMTVYRRRLTSSFYAIERSLERRLEFLEGHLPAARLQDEDDENAFLDFEVDPLELEQEIARFEAEIEYVRDFLSDLRALGADSKVERLKGDLNQIFQDRETVLVFTQYTDTMDHLREELRTVYGGQVACYSGRGGEIWRDGAWQGVGKEWLKEEFRRGEEVKILLCTESASEGLNLQTCGVLINFDMPWNPMRVEQRIGRIDRIGQRYARVWIRNYFYEDTVEATIHARLGDRIQWFEDVIGDLQPILQQVARVIQDVAMSAGTTRRERLDQEIQRLRRALDERETQAMGLDDLAEDRVVEASRNRVPVTLSQLEEVLTQSEFLHPLLTPHPRLAGAWMMSWKGTDVAVTFDREVFDRHPYSVQLLTYGNPLFDEILESVPPPEGGEKEGMAWLRTDRPIPLSMCLTPGGDDVLEVRTLQDYDAAARDGGTQRWVGRTVRAAYDRFQGLVQSERGRLVTVAAARWQAERMALEERARSLLARAAYVELAGGEQGELGVEPEDLAMGAQAVSRLARHGVPFRGLLTLIDSESVELSPDDPEFQAMRGPGGERRRRAVWGVVRREGRDALEALAELENRQVPDGHEGSETVDGGGDPDKILWILTDRPADSEGEA